MRATVRRWAPGVAAIGAAEAALLIYAGTVMDLTGQLRTSASSIAGNLFAVLGAILPGGFVGGVAAILAFLGAGWWQENLLSPAFAGNTGAGLPALGGSLAAPVYAFVRRARRRWAGPGALPRGAPPHRIYLARMAKPFEARALASTAVQECL